ncbi:sigma-70 family RNA polymerase sigma factor [Aquimarina mytili]|uniref:Sigma-70 family RNA polymerase sigma factor n=1 Tax=Aquimarina mytili TaxID=874423 RepID=A0A937A3Q9_9FLAO|nr:sigma-70 family RNA polymerase sigma factor [Aquimarina mytili]MBL0684395.1 sigma-70 family RNA polymerase sigma factor [Aquimarina mytili]
MQNEIKDIWIDLNEELFTFILSKVKDEQVAKDVLQDSFIKVISKINQLEDTSKLTSWVYQITRNTIFDYYRKSKLKKIPIEDIHIPENQNENFEYAKLSNCINQKIQTLTTKHKEAIILTSFKNYTQKELASLLKISYSGTKSRIQKARDILKDKIKDCPNVTFDKTGKLVDFDNN